MKTTIKTIILLLIVCLTACYSRVHSGFGVITASSISLCYKPLCEYKVHNYKGLFNTSVVDTCEKFKIGDTIYITNKK